MKVILIKENKDLVWSDVDNPQPKDFTGMGEEIPATTSKRILNTLTKNKARKLIYGSSVDRKILNILNKKMLTDKPQLFALAL